MVKPVEMADAARQEKVPRSLAGARRLAASCTRCDLYRCGTQTVFGEGPQSARIIMVGEQPGDREDIEGRPFVGPAGRILDGALEDAGIDRRDVYVTNAVKHFKFQQRGKRRLHKKPNVGEIEACRWWLDLERSFIQPAAVVALGATALRSLIGKAVSVSSLRDRAEFLSDGTPLVATVHPSYLLRIRDRDEAHEQREHFIADLVLARHFLEKLETRAVPR